MARVAIVADDLTGALDTAGQWAHLGVRTLVTLGDTPLQGAEAVAIHTASRAATPEQAYCRAKEAAHRLRDHLVYKKIDSTLRGNIGAEVDGLLEGLGLHRALIAPAFPAAGRTVQKGILRVHGVPLADTEFSRDPQWPARESHVPTLLAGQTRRTVGHLPLEVVARGEGAIRRALQASKAELIVADAVETEQLHALAQAALQMPQPWLCCGSAGLAGGWLHTLGLARPATEPFHWPPRTGPVLVVAGSRHPATVRQLRQAQEQREMQWLRIAPGEGEAHLYWGQARQMLAEGHPVALTTAFSPYRPGEEATVAAHLAHAAAGVCARIGILGLILTGGDTAEAVCMALGMAGLEVVGEVQSGIPAANGRGGQGDGLRIVTKAGGFGDDSALVQAIDFIRGAGESQRRER